MFDLPLQFSSHKLIILPLQVCPQVFPWAPVEKPWTGEGEREFFLTNPSVSPGSLNQVFKSPLSCQLTNWTVWACPSDFNKGMKIMRDNETHFSLYV